MELEMLSNNDRAGHSSALADDSLSASKDASRCDIQLLDQEHTPNARRRLLPTGPRRHYQLDELESDLNERAIDDQEIFAFLRDYSQFKEHPSGRLFESLIWINTFAPPVVAAAAVPEDQTAGDDMMLENRQHTKHDGIIRRSTFPAEPNFSENLRLLRSLLMTSESNCFLQLCVLAAESNCIGDLFTFRQNVQASYKAQISRLYGAPRQALIHTLAKEWRIKNDVVWRLLGVNKPARTSLRLPSAGSPPPLLDLNSLTGTSFTLRWQAKSPRYSIDFDIYVWQPFRRAPPDRYAQINMLPAQDKNSRQMILLVENTNQLQRLRESLLPHSNEDDDQFLVEDKIMTSILVVFEQMVYDTTHFMEDAIDQCNNLLYEGRVRPSGSKVQFLTHLSDCLNKAVEDTAHSLLCLSEVKLFLEGYGQSIPDARISSFEKRIEGLKVDLGFLQGECRALEKRINGFDGLRTMINEHINLLQNRRTMIITVLLALYVPLSFMTSFLGMNVTMEKPKKGENPTNKIWSLSTFFATSLPLAFGSIIVPLVLGAVIRYFVQFTAKYRAYWRITYIVILVLYVFVFYIILPALFWVIPKLRYSMFYTDNYLIISIVTDVVIILFAMGQVYWAFRRKSRRVVWVFCLVVFAVTSVFDCLPFAYYSYNYHYSYGNPPVRVMGLVQLALLFLVWSAPRWRRWARNIRRRLSRGTP